MERPKTSVYIATTLDGFIARPDGGIDWLDHDAEGQDYGWEAFRQSIDALIIGRKSYEQVLDFDIAWPYAGLTTVVRSRTLTEADLPASLAGEKVEISAKPPADLLTDLASRPIAHAWIDGGQTVRAFLSAGLVDRLTLTRLPILIGSGRPLFGPIPRDLRLEHLATTAFPTGLVQSTYAPAP